ncbi:type II secretion system F family protein [Marinobacterium arenosum]|uniref:type II secretion system F family protein n=1 Tax=Marinobacterium arenosum TaxID=2862496 RepID=UPI001C96B772|nr:type II secretion system F family protein [Marinobacterium arenosum]MBY4675742.1 type II secretion system F family protein [Marinobacterium arenosum]
MDVLLQMISEQLGNERYAHMIFVSLSAAAALIFGLSLTFLISSLSEPFRQRLHALTNNKSGQKENQPSGDILSSIDPLTKHFVPTKKSVLTQVRLRLLNAGYRSPHALKNFYALKTLLTVGLFFLGLYITSLMPEMSSEQIFLIAVIGGLAGYLLPSMVLEHLAKRRIRQIHNSFPDALDMLVVCVESGLGLNGALIRVADELDVSHPELAEELSLVNSEIRAGVNRIDALKAMAERTGVDDIKGLVALIDQSVRLGGSIANTLRVYSEEFRDKRTQRAEEAAAKIGTKMIFPLTFCLWPGFFLVAVGPAVLKVLEVLASNS